MRYQNAQIVDSKGRLEMLKAERATARAARLAGPGRFEDKRRQAQIAARHALQEVATRLAALSPS